MSTASVMTTTRKGWLAWVRRSPLADLLSFRYTLLRAWTAGGALIAGLIQTFVFARVLDPERFSLFILVGALGMSLWLFDLGLSKILFVRMRKRHLAGEDTLAVAAQANALATLYAVLVAAGAVICFAVTLLRPSTSPWQAAEFALFFFFSAFNLSWFVLRNVSVAVDEYIYFESLESWRRIGYIALMLAMLAGFPFSAFVIAINLGWALLLALAAARLIRRGALAPRLRGILADLRLFLRENGRAAIRTGTHAAGEMYIHTVLYLVVPLALGLGAPTIVLDTALKIFFGSVNLYSAACDLLVPRQTAAYSARDRRTLVRATLMAVTLCALPALAIALLLAIDARGLFALLLGPAAVMPPSVLPVLFVLLAAGVVKSAPNFLLQYTGYFREIAWLSMVNVLVMTASVAIGLAVHLDVVGLLGIYAGVFVMVALLYTAVALRGPIRDAGKAV
jgi:O-antigen/teichoic acid export membrane protein